MNPEALPDLCTGRPVFTRSDLRAYAQARGDAAAWRMAFEAHGTAAPALANGPYAVALQLSDGRVFMAVDRFAVQTLCYRCDGVTLRYAARADALAADDATLDLQALFDYLYFHVIPSPRTIFPGVMRLPAGHCAVFERGRLTVEPYWVPKFEPLSGQVSFDALKAEFRSAMEASVVRELDSGKAGCFLSGGTDSSTVAGMVAKVAGRVSTYSIGFQAEGYDEMEYARIAAKHFGTDHHEYYVTPEDLVRSIPEVAAWYDQPFGNSSAVPAFHCASMAREDGVTRVLAGDGGDELFGGNKRYAMQRVFSWYGNVPGPLRAALEPVLEMRPIAALPLVGKVARYVSKAREPLPDRLESYNLLQRLGVDEVLTPALLQQVNCGGPQTDQRAIWAQARADDDLNRQLAYDWRYTLAENDLPKVCGTTALAGIEVGFPMLDQQMLDFSLRLPTAYKLKGLKLRWFFKEALRGFLPDEILTKKKQGFGLPFGVWTYHHAGLRALAAESLNELARRGIVRSAFVDTLMGARLAEHPGYFGEMIWILMMLEQWLRRHRPGFAIAA